MFQPPEKTPYSRNEGSSAGSRPGDAVGVGKRTLVESLECAPVQRKVATPDRSGAPDAHAAAAGQLAPTAQVAPTASPLSHTDRIARLFGPAPIQRKTGGGADQAPGEPPPASGGGAMIPDAARQRMERSFGADFSTVRIHEGPQAAAMGAVAYARGEDIYFQPGRYDPSSPAGLELLGHELTHVVQQRAGRVARPQGKDSPVVPDPSLEAEADAAGARAARGEAAGIHGTGGSAAADGPIQRYTDVTLDKQPWRLSQKQRILAPAKDSKHANKELYADAGDVASASAALAQSNIALDTVDAPPGTAEAARAVADLKLHRVVAMFKPRQDQGGKSLELKALKAQNDTVGGLQTFADCNETARLIMGSDNRGPDMEAPVTTATPSGGERMHERLDDDAYGNSFTSSMGGVVTEVEARGLTAIVESLIAFRDHKLPEFVHDKQLGSLVPQAQELLAQLSPKAPTPAWQALHRLKTECLPLYDKFAAFAGIDAEAMPRIGDSLVTFRSTDPRGQRITRSARLYQALLAKTSAHELQQIGITAETPYAEVQVILNQLDNPQLNQVLNAKSLWNKHWAGVILTDGVDYATLENDASTEESSLLDDDSGRDKNDQSAKNTRGKINQQWWFNLYGADGKQGHSFHDQEMGTEDFGNFAATLRFRRPPPKQKVDVKAYLKEVLKQRLTPEVLAKIDPGARHDLGPLIDQFGNWAEENKVNKVRLADLVKVAVAELQNELKARQLPPIVLEVPQVPDVPQRLPPQQQPPQQTQQQPSHDQSGGEDSEQDSEQDDRWFWERHPYLTVAAGGLIVGSLLALVSKFKK
jgi:hypothetical protein